MTDAPDRDPGWRAPTVRGLGAVVAHTRTWWQANAVLGTFLVVVAVIAGVMVWLSGEVYESVAGDDGVSMVDPPLLHWMIAHRTPGVTAFFQGLSTFGGPVVQPVVVLLVALAISYRWRSWSPLVLLAIGLGMSVLATVLGKKLIGRQRPLLIDAVPPLESTASFPSGHTLNATVVAGLLAYLMYHWSRTRGARIAWIAGLAVYALVMGIGRVYLGHHWLTDVIVGWTLGIAWALVVIVLHRLWLLARARHGEPKWFRLSEPREP